MNGEGIQMPKEKFKFDRNFYFSLGAVLILVALGGWLYFRGDLSEVNNRLGNCEVLPQEYCDSGVEVEYNGYEALAFILPEGTSIYMPFDGAYFDESPEGLPFVTMRLGVPNTSSFVFMVGRHAPYLETGSSVRKGQLIAITVNDPDTAFIDQDGANFIIYSENYALSQLF